MKVWLVDERHDRIYGSQRTLVEHALELNRSGVDAELCTSGPGALADFAESSGVTTRFIWFDERSLKYGKVLLTGRLRMRLLGVWGLLRSSWALAAGTKDVDVVVAASIRPLLVMALPRLLGRVRVLWYVQNAEHFLLASVLGSVIADHVCPIATESDVAWIGKPLSVAERSRLGSSLAPVPAPEAAQVLVQPPGREEQVELVFVGALIQRKAPDRAIEVASELGRLLSQPVRLRLFGETPHENAIGYREQLERLAVSAACEVMFVGWADDIAQELRRSHVLLFLSRSDAWGRVVPEALSVGVPVLGCAELGAIRALVTDGVNGWVVEQGESPEATAARLLPYIHGTEALTQSTDAASAVGSDELRLALQECAGHTRLDLIRFRARRIRHLISSGR